MKLFYKILLSLLLFSIIPLIILGGLISFYTKKSVTDIRMGQLETIANLKAQRIQILFQEVESELRTAQATNTVKYYFPVIAKYADTPSDPRYLEAKNALEEEIEAIWKNRKYLTDVMFVRADGQIAYSSEDEHPTVALRETLIPAYRKAFAEGRDKFYVGDVFKNDHGQLELLVTAPIVDTAGKFGGVLAFEVDMDYVFDFVQDTTGLGQTGETLIGVKEGDGALILNASRYGNISALTKVSADDENLIIRSVREQNGQGFAKDYNSNDVIAVWRYLPELNWGMVVKIDAKEAFITVDELRLSILYVVFGVLFLSLIVACIVADSFLQPIYRLQMALKAVGDSHLDLRIASTSKDEMGMLSVAFDDMAENLQNSYRARDEIEQRLSDAKRLESVGIMTGGIAHDFNNILTVIQGNLELLEDFVEEEPRQKKLLARAEKAVNRATVITSGLLAFSRKQVLRPLMMDVNRLIVNMPKIFPQNMLANISFNTDLDGSINEIYVDKPQLESALLNIILNAIDAMPSGGGITIKTYSVVFDSREKAPDMLTGEFICIAVKDSGVGIEPELLPSVLEPFFTTKEVGMGTGLGLSMVYGFSKQSGGTLTIDSKVGEGTLVSIYLPCGQPEKDIEEEIEEILLQDIPHGTENILVVEDDPDLLELATDILEGFGYNITKALGTAIASDILIKQKDFGLLLTDVVMPGKMDGQEFAEYTKSIVPDIKVLYMSGFTRDVLMEQGQLKEDVTLVQKPFTRSILATEVRTMLDS